MQNIYKDVAARLDLPEKSVEAVAFLLGDGATVPFISRYRKEKTGSLDEVAIRAIESTLKSVEELYNRRDFVRKAIADAGCLDSMLGNRLDNARSITEIEDIYAPFKPKKRTRGTMARDKGLEPLAKMIMAAHSHDCHILASRFVGKKGVADPEEALSGASDIIAEWASENAKLRNMTRNVYQKTSRLVCTPAKNKDQELASSPFAQYADFTQKSRRISSHQYLALRRAEHEGLLKVKYELDSTGPSLEETLADAFMPRNAGGECATLIAGAVADATKRLIKPSIETEISMHLKEEADRVAIDIFSENLRQLLLASPLKGRRILAIDPGFRTGCKVVALDEQGTLLDDAVIYPTMPKNDTEGTKRILQKLISRHRLDAAAIGNGTASRETEKFLRQSGVIDPDSIFVISEDGASVYSASDTARQEFPDKDVTVRGAVSIGRRLIDPLAELVKIDPKSIGVGQYQHDVDQTKLKNALDYTVVSCVNAVGVDVNTASESLLRYVSGIGSALAANIVAYRRENGPFASRRDLMKVPRLGVKAYEQCAGFLRISDGNEPLDNTGIHPESYGLVNEMAKSIGATPGELPANSRLLDAIDIRSLAEKGTGGYETMRDIIEELRKPGRDPRQDDAADVFIPAIDSFEQLRTGQILPGLVSNITAFGAFINLGIHENGLLHISKISRRRINSVSEVLHLGQKIEVEVIDLDPARGRISLALVSKE